MSAGNQRNPPKQRTAIGPWEYYILTIQRNCSLEFSPEGGYWLGPFGDTCVHLGRLWCTSILRCWLAWLPPCSCVCDPRGDMMPSLSSECHSKHARFGTSGHRLLWVAKPKVIFVAGDCKYEELVVHFIHCGENTPRSINAHLDHLIFR